MHLVYRHVSYIFLHLKIVQLDYSKSLFRFFILSFKMESNITGEKVKTQ